MKVDPVKKYARMVIEDMPFYTALDGRKYLRADMVEEHPELSYLVNKFHENFEYSLISDVYYLRKGENDDG